jgi:hypothetical protein
MTLGAGLGRIQASETDPPSHLTWTSATLKHDLNVVGDIELQLDAASTASDTAWIVLLQDVDPVGAVTEITAGYLRAGLRGVDSANSRVGAPQVPCRTFQAIPIGELVPYRIPLVANARRFKAGHCVRLFITSDDQTPDSPTMLGFRHASVGTSSVNTIKSSSRLILTVLTASG